MRNADQTQSSFSALRRPLFPLAAAFALGILTAECAAPPAAPAVVVGMFALVLLLVRKSRSHAALLLVCAAVFCAGTARYRLYTKIEPNDVSGLVGPRDATVIGVVAADPETSGQSSRLVIRVDRAAVGGRWAPAAGSLLARVYNSAAGSRLRVPGYGSRILIRGRLVTPPEPTNPGAFSYRAYLARQRIYCMVYVRHPGQIKAMGAGGRNLAVALAGSVRRGMGASIKRLMPQPQAAIAEGMALGTYATLPDEVFDGFSRTGTLHLLAASGFNCAVIFGAVLLLFRLLRLPRRWGYFAAIPALVFYMLLVGAKPSIVRATIMALMLALAYVLGRPPDGLNVLSAAALVVLGLQPTDLFDVGFQLSFAAVLAIILVLPVMQPLGAKIYDPEPVRPRRLSRPEAAGRLLVKSIVEAAMCTAAATLGTLPITAAYFNQLSIVSVPVNAAVALLAPPVFVIGLFAPVFAAIPILGQAIAWTGFAAITAMLAVVNWFAAPPWACLAWRSPGIVGAGGYYLALGAAAAYVSGKIKTPG